MKLTLNSMMIISPELYFTMVIEVISMLTGEKNKNV
jgi:hypothetical protein